MGTTTSSRLGEAVTCVSSAREYAAVKVFGEYSKLLFQMLLGDIPASKKLMTAQHDLKCRLGMKPDLAWAEV